MRTISSCLRWVRRAVLLSGLSICAALVTSACYDNPIVGPPSDRAVAHTAFHGDTCRVAISLFSAPRERTSDLYLDDTGDFEPIEADEPLDMAGGDYCTDEYNRLIAKCRTLRKKVDRAICYAAAMDWYVNCKYPWDKCGEQDANIVPGDLARLSTTSSTRTGSRDLLTHPLSDVVDPIGPCDLGNGTPAGAGGGTDYPGCSYEMWEISYDGGLTWEFFGWVWVCNET